MTARLVFTGLGHGDAMRVRYDPTRPGLESGSAMKAAVAGRDVRDAATGQIIWDHYNAGDVGRAVMAILMPVMWAIKCGLMPPREPITPQTSRSAPPGRLRIFLFIIDDLRGNCWMRSVEARQPDPDKWWRWPGRLISLYSVPTSLQYRQQ